MIQLLQRASSWKFILPLFLLFCGFSFFLFPYYQSQLNNIAGEEVSALDTRFSYSVSEVDSDFGKLGVEGRNVYRIVTGRIDMVYPVIYGMLFILILAYLIKRNTRPGSTLMLFALIPAAGVVFDYLENFNTLRLLNRYPELSEQQVALGEQMTRMKHGFLFFSLLMIVLLAMMMLIKRLFSRPGPDSIVGRG